MTPEERKIYNNKYYANKKFEINEKLQNKVECPLCGRVVAHQNLQQHFKSKICFSRRRVHKMVKEIMNPTVVDLNKLTKDLKPDNEDDIIDT